MHNDMNIEDTLQMGISAHKLGKIHEAERYYTAILRVEPEHPHANHNMGLLAALAGKPVLTTRRRRRKL